MSKYSQRERQRLINKLQRDYGVTPTESRIRYLKELENLKRRIKSYEKKTGKKVDTSHYIPNEMPKRVTKRHIEAIKNIRHKDFQANATTAAPDIADIVLENLRSFIQSYENPGVRPEYLDGRKFDLLNYLDVGVAQHGKKAVAENAERLNEQMGFAQEYMDESKAERAGVLLGQFGEAVFGRAFSFAELVGVERHEEYNGNYA